MREFIAEPLGNNVEEMFIGPFGSSLKNEDFVPAEDAFCIVYEQKHAIRKTMDVETRYVNAEKYEELKRFTVKGGDIIVSCRGTIGETYVIPEDAPMGIMHPSIMKIRLKPNVYDKKFFDLLLNSHLQKHVDEANGSGVKMAITATALGKELFAVPPIIIQQHIATSIDKVSDLIAMRKKQFQKLDDLVKSRFVEMFGDPITNPRGLPIHQLGNHIIFLTSGSRGWSQYFTDTGEYFITIKNVKGCRISLENVQHVMPPQNAEAARTRVEEGDLLISITADLGRTGVVSKEIAAHGAYINQHLTCIRLDRKVLHPLYVAYYLESAAGKEQFYAKNQNGVKAGLNFNAINSLHLLIPSMSEQKDFVAFVEQTDKSKLTIQQSLDKLELMKKTLMQKYFG